MLIRNQTAIQAIPTRKTPNRFPPLPTHHSHDKDSLNRKTNSQIVLKFTIELFLNCCLIDFNSKLVRENIFTSARFLPLLHALIAIQLNWKSTMLLKAHIWVIPHYFFACLCKSKPSLTGWKTFPFIQSSNSRFQINSNCDQIISWKLFYTTAKARNGFLLGLMFGIYCWLFMFVQSFFSPRIL